MGNPLRFLGTGRETELDDVVLPPRCAVEVTFRTQQQRFLLRPDREATELLLGCFGRAYDRYPSLNVAALSVLSNHGCFVAMPESAWVLSRFMRDFLSTAATRLNGHRDREGTFWERRYRSIPIADHAALENRFEYVLTQGTKENLVADAREWPGITSIPALLGGRPLVGRWRDYSAEYEPRRQRARRIERAAARGKALSLPKPEPVWREYPIRLEPLPHWQELPVGKRRARVAELVREDARRTRERHARDGTRPLGASAIVTIDPFARPHAPKRSPAPLCHASSGRVRRAFRKAYRLFVDAVRAAAQALSELVPTVGVPPGATVSPICFEAIGAGQGGACMQVGLKAGTALLPSTGPPRPGT